MGRQLARFMVAGGIGFVVDTGVLYLALSLHLGYFAGRAVSFLCAVWTTWQINRRYSFVSSRPRPVAAEWWRYLVAMSAGGSVNYAAYSIAVSLLRPSPWLPIFAVSLGSVASSIVNFAAAKWWVFKHTESETS